MLIEQYIRDGVKKIDRDKYLRKILKAIASDLKNLTNDRFDHDADLLEIIDIIKMVAKDVWKSQIISKISTLAKNTRKNGNGLAGSRQK